MIFARRIWSSAVLWTAGLGWMVLATAGAGPAAAASQCVPRKISATGGNSGMSFFAKARARSAWTRKVSADQRLGPNYAQWLRAADRTIVCRKIDNRYVCLAAGTPCRSGRVVSVSPDLGKEAKLARSSIRPVKPARPL